MSANDLLTKGLGFGHVSLLVTQGLGQDAEEQAAPQPAPPAQGSGGSNAKRWRGSTRRPLTYAEAEDERRRRLLEEQAARQRRAAELERARVAAAAAQPTGPLPTLPDEIAALQAAAREAWQRRTAAEARQAEAARRAAEAQAQAEAARLAARARDEEEALILLIALAA